MKLTKTSMISGKSHTMDIPLDGQELNQCYNKWEAGALIQDAFPTLSPELREFIKTGITPEEWDELFGVKQNNK
jgi:hypothetical protein